MPRKPKNYSISPELAAHLTSDHGVKRSSRDLSKPFVWTMIRSQAAALLAEGRLSKLAIAKQLGITSDSVNEWSKHPDFMAEVRAIEKRISSELQRITIANRKRRMEYYQRQHEIYFARLEKTQGAIVDKKLVGDEIVDVERTDAGLGKILLDIAKQAAIEAGDWTSEGASRNEFDTATDCKVTLEDKRTFILNIFNDLGRSLTADALAELKLPPKEIPYEPA